ncbi:aldehyde dehydrogenase [Sporosarcina sp. Te-1]|uniref:aldehyde dehydrogenase n=1 Tax=Sporosarcina sp. Te-1 TaxID=2818390 RepID=UPI001A9E25ED|nr:aldehyde dehydrogenase [Sporosarcina sp. Te-1]QTD42505.1 aldehyde dehydrogenase [Sporosarcina sp. Te-1]
METIHVEQIIRKQQNFYFSRATRSAAFRKDMLDRLRGAIKRYESDILNALWKDLHKSPFEAYMTEVGFILDSISHVMKNLDDWLEMEHVKTPLHLQPAQSCIIREPYGSVLIIGPFNYPFQLVMEPLIGAIAGGNCVVVKPSEFATHTGELVQKILSEIFPSEYVYVVEGGVRETSALIHGPFDYLFFTGSARVGKIVMKAAAERLTPFSLELGGKSPAIVDPTAKLDKAAERIVWGKFLNNGQTCIAPDYVVVHESIHDSFLRELKSAICRFYGQDASKSSDYGRIIHQKHFDRLEKLLQCHRSRVSYGGRSERGELYIEPTLLESITWNDPVMEEEIFGPILPILQYDHLGSLIHKIRQLPKPLAAYMFTENEKAADYFTEQLPFGGGCINDTISHVANHNLPFGGVGSSGMNAYHGKASFETFTHAKSVMRKSTAVSVKFGYPPYKNKLPILKRLLR